VQDEILLPPITFLYNRKGCNKKQMVRDAGVDKARQRRQAGFVLEQSRQPFKNSTSSIIEFFYTILF